MSRLEINFLHSEGEQAPSGLTVSESLPRPPHGTSAAAAVLQRGGRGAAGSLMELLLLLLEALQRRDRSLCAGADREKLARVAPEIRAALVVVAVTRAWLQLLPQEADGHLQDVGFLQLGVGLLLVKLLLEDDLELLDAAVDAISAHFFNKRFSQLRKRKQPS